MAAEAVELPAGESAGRKLEGGDDEVVSFLKQVVLALAGGDRAGGVVLDIDGSAQADPGLPGFFSVEAGRADPAVKGSQTLRETDRVGLGLEMVFASK